MAVIYHAESRTFHLYNDAFSYIFKIMDPGIPVHLYYGRKIHDRDAFDYLLETARRPMAVVLSEDRPDLSLEHLKLEYPVYGTGDMRNPALDVRHENGSRLLELLYENHQITAGKSVPADLPGVYTEKDEEAETLALVLRDAESSLQVILYYSVMEEMPVLIRSAQIVNAGQNEIRLETAMSLSLDLPEMEYDMITLTGAWARERHVRRSPLHEGVQSIGSLRGFSSNNFSPFFALAEKNTDENSGTAVGVSIIYSGSFLAEAAADTYHTVRIRIGIHPETFEWHLQPGDSFRTPEAVLVYSDAGLNGMSQAFHTLCRTRIARGIWRDRCRPVLVNNWEGTYFDFDEEKLLAIARCAKDLGMEMFVLDDGWFRCRSSDRTGLGDWIVDTDKFPRGIRHFTDAVHAMGLLCGIWIEPEMVSPGTDLFREHPEWIIHEEGRPMHAGRHQYVLDYSNPDVVDAVFEKISAVLAESRVDYVKWDMNRSMSDVYSMTLKHQGELMHRYILGVYALYSRLIEKFPGILFESCASGGARFDMGMLYYAPQCWTSDDTDAYERQKIQYGTSYVYPLSSMGSHVSAVPNHQLHRSISFKTRADTAYFGTFGYELDLTKLTEEEKAEVRRQICFMKEHRQLIQFGTFFRLRSPFEGNETAWMCVSPDRSEAVIAYYRQTQEVNAGYRRIRLQGLDPDGLYAIEGQTETYYGDALMHAGLLLSDASCGEEKSEEGDYISRLYVLKRIA